MDKGHLFGWSREGWQQLALWSAALTIMCVIAVVHYGTGEDGVRAAIRWTARTSLIAFFISFVIGPLNKHWRNDTTRKLMRARRYWGLSFFISHMLHFVCIIALVFVAYNGDFGRFFDLRDIFGGGSVYLIVTLMAITSTTQWQQRLGPKNWRRLHLTGQLYVWVIFTLAFGGYAFFGSANRGSPTVAAIVFALLVGAMILRMLPARKSSQQT